jgi:hypothetical protein
MNTFYKRSAMVAVATATTVALGASSALAADDTNLTVTGGSLSITNPAVGDFTGVSVTGLAQSSTGSVDAFTVADNRGTGSGWNVTVQATQMREYDSVADAYVTAGRSLAASSLKLSQSSVSSPDTTSADPTIVTGPYTIDSGTAVKVASAAANTGMGAYTFSAPTLTVSLPADVYAGAYRGTVTVSVVSGP